MNMKASLHLQLSQQLTLTPQLQQAIRLLQLSTVDLQQEIEQALEKNPLLELDNDQPEIPEVLHTYEHHSDVSVDVSMSQDEMPRELPVDTAWEDICPTQNAAKNSNSEDGPNYDNINTATESLQDHLIWQMELTPFSDVDKNIAVTLIDAISNDGFLDDTIENLRLSINRDEHNPELHVSDDEIIAVLHRIQRFDPIGVGARDLRECLLIQLDQFPADTPYLKLAKAIVSKHLDLLGSRQYKQLARMGKLSDDDLRAILSLIQSLHPKPGDLISSEKIEYIIPDVIVKKEENRWTVELNADAIPRLRIAPNYAAFGKGAELASDTTFIKNNLQEAKFFIKSLQSRNETLLRVATAIVKHQRDFLEFGAEAMKPLVLAEIATALDLHESTISRITTQKFMHTPLGIFELKYFFSSHVATAAGGECSSTAIRAVIKKLIANENPSKPLSDSKIAEVLQSNGVHVARRTIAKYREALHIPSSNERRNLMSNLS